MPEPMISETQVAGLGRCRGRSAKKVRVASGLRRIRSTTSVTTPSVPSLPTSTPEQIVARRIQHRAAQVHHLARRR